MAAGRLLLHLTLCATLSLLTLVEGMNKLNCQEAFASGDVNSGEKLLYTSSGASFYVWCWYSSVTNEGLLYLRKDAVRDVSINFSQLNIHTNKVALTFFTQLYTGGSTYRGDLCRIDGQDVTVLQSTATGFVTPPYAANHPHYLYLGILRYAEANMRSLQGFQLNGADCTFLNCDSNPNSNFAFFIENISKRKIVDNFLIACTNNNLQLITANDRIPPGYRFAYEATFGGCGAHITANNLNGYEAGNIGLWFSYDSCGDPGEVKGGTRIVSDPAFRFGSMVTYICDEVQRTSGDLVRRCERETGWSGESPTCGDQNELSPAVTVGASTTVTGGASTPLTGGMSLPVIVGAVTAAAVLVIIIIIIACVWVTRKGRVNTETDQTRRTGESHKRHELDEVYQPGADYEEIPAQGLPAVQSQERSYEKLKVKATPIAKWFKDKDIQKATAKKLKHHGIVTIQDLQDMSETNMVEIGLNVGDRNRIARALKESTTSRL